MNLLFIHQNFPGQFFDLAPALAKYCGGRAIFLTRSDNPQGIKLPSISVKNFKLARQVGPDIHPYLRAHEAAILNAQAVLRKIFEFLEEGFKPDIVICQGGTGLGVYIKQLLPVCRLISYQEWYFSKENLNSVNPGLSFDTRAQILTKNQIILHEIAEADTVVCPTRWQYGQFPDFVRSKMQIIFDGINQKLFYPRVIRRNIELKFELEKKSLLIDSDSLVLSYGTRGMEPLRGFPEFMRAAVVAQKEFPNLQVIVYGADRTAYGAPCPSHPSGSWKQALLSELSEEIDFGRIHFPGLLDYGDMINLLCRSDLHCYFTRPYIVSWGVFQAAACGANLLVNDFPGIDEVFQVVPTSGVVDLESQTSVNAAILTALKNAESHKKSLRQPVSTLRKDMNLEKSIQSWLNLLKLH